MWMPAGEIFIFAKEKEFFHPCGETGSALKNLFRSKGISFPFAAPSKRRVVSGEFRSADSL
jgi:hypothetical protein